MILSSPDSQPSLQIQSVCDNVNSIRDKLRSLSILCKDITFVITFFLNYLRYKIDPFNI